MFFRTEEEETPCSRERAEEEVVCCGFERQDTGYIYVDLWGGNLYEISKC